MGPMLLFVSIGCIILFILLSPMFGAIGSWLYKVFGNMFSGKSEDEEWKRIWYHVKRSQVGFLLV